MMWLMMWKLIKLTRVAEILYNSVSATTVLHYEAGNVLMVDNVVLVAMVYSEIEPAIDAGVAVGVVVVMYVDYSTHSKVIIDKVQQRLDYHDNTTERNNWPLINIPSAAFACLLRFLEGNKSV